MATIVQTLPNKASLKADTRFLLYFMLRSSGFFASTLLMTFGAYVVFFLAIGGFSLDGMMHHLANLSGRYVEADAARIAGFKTIAGGTFMALALAISFFRRHALIGVLTAATDRGND